MKYITLLLSVLLVSAAALAHGNFEHVMGTVSKIAGNSITVTTVNRESKTVTVDAATKFIKSGVTAGLGGLKVGDRVVIHAKPTGTSLQAVEVRFGETPRAPSPQH